MFYYIISMSNKGPNKYIRLELHNQNKDKRKMEEFNHNTQLRLRAERASCILTHSLLDVTRRHLLATKIPLAAIARDVNLPYQWVMNFRDGKARDPSVNRVQAVYEYLTGHNLTFKEPSECQQML